MIGGLLRRAVPVLVAMVLGGVVVANVGGEERVTLAATFPDVADLVVDAHVRVADVPVGTIEAIELTDDHRARVELSVEAGTGLPAEVVAVLRSTSLLGERYVELRPADGATGTLDDGGRVVGTRVVEGLEQLVASGNDLFGAVAADELAQAVRAGAVAFGGRGSALGAVLEDLRGAVGAYADGRDDLARLIDASDALLADLAADAEVHADVLADLDRFATALDEEDERLFAALEDLSRLSDVGARILRTNRASLDSTIMRFSRIATELTRIDMALQNVLTWFPRHNLHVPNGVVLEQSQVWNDFVVCGVHDEPDNPANSCTPPNPGRSNHPAPGHEHTPCDTAHRGCPYPPRVEPGTGREPR